MHRRSLSNDYKNYPYVLPSYSPPSRNGNRQNYDPIQHTEQALYPNIPLNSRNTSANVQHQPQSLPIISNLSEPISIFDDLKPLARHRSNLSSLSSGYIPPNPIQRSSVSDARLFTANAMRERLLTDIHDNITEIDRELSTLEIRPSISNYIPPRFSSDNGSRQTSFVSQQKNKPHNARIDEQDDSSEDEEKKQRKKKSKKKVYEVIPRTASTSSKHSITKLTDPQPNPISYVGQYHYAIEIGEHDTDEEDTDKT
ncbi:unnamed protein product, partial [Adineta steineri]